MNPDYGVRGRLTRCCKGENQVYSSLRDRFTTMAVVLLALLAFSLAGCSGDDSFTDTELVDDDIEFVDDDVDEVTPPEMETFTVTGSGSDLIPFEVREGGAVTFELTHTGDENFIVRLLDNDAENIALLTNKIGDVSDTRVENLSQGSYFLDIDSTGEWSVSITAPTATSPGTEPAPDPDTPQLSLLGGLDSSVGGTANPPATTLTPAGADRSGSTTTLAIVLDRPAPDDLEINYAMVGNAESFTLDGVSPQDGSTLLIPSGSQVLPFTIQAIGEVFDAAELQFVAGEGYAFTGQATALFEITLDRLPLARFARVSEDDPISLTVPEDETRNAAVILDPDRPAAPTPDGLRINFVLVDDAEVLQNEDDITETPGEPVPDTDPVDEVIEVNNAQPLEIAGGDFAVTFQVTRPGDNDNEVRMILIGGDGYTVEPDEILVIK